MDIGEIEKVRRVELPDRKRRQIPRHEPAETPAPQKAPEKVPSGPARKEDE